MQSRLLKLIISILLIIAVCVPTSGHLNDFDQSMQNVDLTSLEITLLYSIFKFSEQYLPPDYQPGENKITGQLPYVTHMSSSFADTLDKIETSVRTGAMQIFLDKIQPDPIVTMVTNDKLDEMRETVKSMSTEDLYNLIINSMYKITSKDMNILKWAYENLREDVDDVVFITELFRNLVQFGANFMSMKSYSVRGTVPLLVNVGHRRNTLPDSCKYVLAITYLNHIDTSPLNKDEVYVIDVEEPQSNSITQTLSLQIDISRVWSLAGKTMEEAGDYSEFFNAAMIPHSCASNKIQIPPSMKDVVQAVSMYTSKVSDTEIVSTQAMLETEFPRYLSDIYQVFLNTSKLISLPISVPVPMQYANMASNIHKSTDNRRRLLSSNMHITNTTTTETVNECVIDGFYKVNDGQWQKVVAGAYNDTTQKYQFGIPVTGEVIIHVTSGLTCTITRIISNTIIKTTTCTKVTNCSVNDILFTSTITLSVITFCLIAFIILICTNKTVRQKLKGTDMAVQYTPIKYEYIVKYDNARDWNTVNFL